MRHHMDGGPRTEYILVYDHLVLALGSLLESVGQILHCNASQSSLGGDLNVR